MTDIRFDRTGDQLRVELFWFSASAKDGTRGEICLGPVMRGRTRQGLQERAVLPF
jgi:hypothetical protein